MQLESFNSQLLDFLSASPTPFHAVDNMVATLVKNGFEPLSEADAWSLEPGGRYFLTRNGSSLIAFVVGRSTDIAAGIRMVGAHTDSPTLMVKPKPEKVQDYFQLGVEVYGGALLNPWFDRDLSLAGRVVYRDTNRDVLDKCLVNFARPVACIPSLAIHLDREANKTRSVNPQTDILPILFNNRDESESDFRKLLAEQVSMQHGIANGIEVLEYEMCLYDTHAPAIVGLYDDFIASARLDNLLSCFSGLQALLDVNSEHTCMLICTDHEEVGSASACGAQGPMLATTLERLFPVAETRSRVIAQSLLISADNAHGIHPNYSDRHDANHAPVLNQGLVLKVNHNQRYATSSLTGGRFRQWCDEEKVPLQTFVTRTDLACGSTIGPITAAEVGVPTLDVGVPTFAMHSIRELAGTRDAHCLVRVMTACFNHPGALNV